jgi:hypothetical protein
MVFILHKKPLEGILNSMPGSARKVPDKWDGEVICPRMGGPDASWGYVKGNGVYDTNGHYIGHVKDGTGFLADGSYLGPVKWSEHKDSCPYKR